MPDKPMRIADLRKALEGVDDDLIVYVDPEGYSYEPATLAEVQTFDAEEIAADYRVRKVRRTGFLVLS